jgi:hypothetical protein
MKKINQLRSLTQKIEDQNENRRLLENEGSETVLNFILKNQQI